MKEITCYATNTLALVTDGKLEPQAEIALVLAEPNYRLTSDGQLARERSIETVRFSASPEVLRKLAAKLNKTADDTEAEVVAAHNQWLEEQRPLALRIVKAREEMERRERLSNEAQAEFRRRYTDFEKAKAEHERLVSLQHNGRHEPRPVE